MRNDIRKLIQRNITDQAGTTCDIQKSIPNHVGIAYDMWAPIGVDGRIPTEVQQVWFKGLEAIQISANYRHAFERWKQGLIDQQAVYLEIELLSRLLVGHGNPSPTEVGLTVHHTWGVPVIPGSALKGLLNHYIQIVLGPDPCECVHPFASDQPEPDRRDYQGVTWKGSQIKHGPGKIHRAFFGAPEAESDEALRRDYPEFEEYIGASQGLVCFHDALYIPGSIGGDQPYAKDILTVHQKAYYGNAGRHGQGPNDYDDPNPVAFLTVRPKVKFLIALSGPSDWAALAIDLLAEALEKWGIGGKTSAGYGKAKVATSRSATEEERKAGLMNSEPFLALSKIKSQELVSRIDGLVKGAEKAFANQPQIKTEWAKQALGRISEVKLEKKHKDKPWFKALQDWSNLKTNG